MDPEIIDDTYYCFSNDIAITPGPEPWVIVVCQAGAGVPADDEGPSDIKESRNYFPFDAEISDFEDPAVVTSTNVGVNDMIPAQPDRHIGAEPGVVIDRSGGLYHGRVYLVYTDESEVDNDDTDIYVRFNADDGQGWSEPVLVNDDNTTNKSQFLPRIAVDQTSGYVAVSWHDCRSDDDPSYPDPPFDGPNNDAELFASMSVNGGLSFLGNVPVSQGISDEDDAEPHQGSCCDDLDYGDYTGLAFAGGYFYPAWADNSNSTGDNPSGAFDVYTARVVPEPGRLPMLGSGIAALCGLSFLRARDRGLGPLPG